MFAWTHAQSQDKPVGASGEAREEKCQSVCQNGMTISGAARTCQHYTSPNLSSNDAQHIRIVQSYWGPGNMHSTARWGKCSKLDHTVKSLFERTDFNSIQEILQMMQQFPLLIELCLEPGECLQDI